MQYDTTRVYLNRVIPWVEGAFVTVHHTSPNKRYDPTQPVSKANKPFWLNGQAFKTPDEIINYLRYLSRKPDALDVYIGMSAQGRAEERQTAGGRTYLNAVRGQDFSVGHKSLYMDLDVKTGSDAGYGSQVELFSAFKQFLKDTGLPVPTLLVASGTGGAHAYWCLDRVLHRDEWSPLAQALAEATRRHGFKNDTQCIVDTVRILRPPETWNRKQSVPLPVVMGDLVQPGDISVEHMRSVLMPYHGAKVIPLNTAQRAVGTPNDELTSGIQAGAAKPLNVATVAKACGFVHEALATGGQSFSNPLWNIGTLLASFMQGEKKDGTAIDSRTIAHAMAHGHPGYVQADTEDLFNRKVAERQNRNLGWPSCKAIENAGCKNCGTCQYKVFQKSPLSHGLPFVASAPQAITTAQVVPLPGVAPQNAQTIESDLPAGYIATVDGRVSRISIGTDGQATKKPVCDYVLHTAYLQSNPWVLHFSTRFGTSGRDTVISIPTAILQSREYGKYLAGQGMVTSPDQQKELQEFLLSWVGQLQRMKDTIQSSPFGWSVDHGKIEGFVYGGRCWSTTGDRAAAIAHEVIAAQFRPTGELAQWKAACDFITQQNRPALNAILACAFGSPLMRFTGMAGSIVSAYSTGSGIGKTTTMEVAQAVWGHPKKGMNSLDDTQNSVMNKAGQLRALPLMWDELKGHEQKAKFVRVAFQITGGKEKSRLNSDAVQRDPGTWQTMVVAASNDSLLDVIQRELKTTEAGILRVFEYTVEPSKHPGTHSHGYVSRLVASCQDNFGVAGLEYAKFLGANHARVADEVAKCQDYIVAALHAPNDERFWIATITCMIMGAKYAKELGLASIDEKGLFRFLQGTLADLRALRKVTTVDVNRPDALANILAMYMAELATRYTLVTDHMNLTRGRGITPKVLSDTTKLETVLVRVAKDDKTICIAKDHFIEWLVKKEYAPNSVLQALHTVFHVRSGQHVLASGTPLASTAIRRNCLIIDYSGTLFDDVMEKDQ